VIAPEAVHRELGRYRFPVAREAELQAAVARALAKAGMPYVSQCRLGPADVVDFAVDLVEGAGCIALELKTDGSLQLVAMQLLRYAEHASVRAIVLATTKHRHASLPSTMNGKPLLVAVLRTAW